MNNINISTYGKTRLLFLKNAIGLLTVLIMTFLLVMGALPGRSAAQDRDPARKKAKKEIDRGAETRKKRVDPGRTGDRTVRDERDRKDRDERGRRSNEVRKPRRPSEPRDPSIPRRPRKPEKPGGFRYKDNHPTYYDPPRPGIRPGPWYPIPGLRRPGSGHVEIIFIDLYLSGMYGEYPHPDSLIDGHFDENRFIIALPFGSILPWEVGEDFLIWLRGLEDSGQEQSAIVCIIQMMEPGGFDDFLKRFGREEEEVTYYDTLSDRSFLVAAPVMTISRLLSDTGIRWIGEYLDEYKIVPGGNGPRTYISSLEGDMDEFREDLEAFGMKVEGFREVTGEYVALGSENIMSELAGLWWVGRLSGNPSRRIRYSDDYGLGTSGQ